MAMNIKGFGFLLLLAAPLYGGQQLIPAGSLMTCKVNEKISSKTVAVGDPVLCTLDDRRTSAAYVSGSLSGQFQEYQDPGHFVGKGWMEIAFDQLILPDAQTVPITAKVVNAPGYHMDLDGKILGKGHAVRDTITWFIPVLWPIDIINLPRRGPRPTLKPERQITVKIMENVWVVVPDQMAYSGPPPDEPASTYQADANYGFAQRPLEQPELAANYTSVYQAQPVTAVGFFAAFKADWQRERARIREQHEAYARFVQMQRAQFASRRYAGGWNGNAAGVTRRPVTQTRAVVTRTATGRVGGHR